MAAHLRVRVVRGTIALLIFGAVLTASVRVAQTIESGDPQTAVASSQPMTWFHGRVQHNPNVYLIFWGNKWTADNEVVGAAIKLFRSLPGSSYQAILNQYCDGGGCVGSPNLRGSFIDAVQPIPQQPCETTNVRDFSTEIATVSTAHSWKVDANTQFIIFTEPGITPCQTSAAHPAGDECAYHGRVPNGESLFVVVPYFDQTYAKCKMEPSPADNATRAVSHEYAEAATDPDGNGWRTDNVNSQEVGDQCAKDVAVLSGVVVQDLWDNGAYGAIGVGCSSTARGPVSNPQNPVAFASEVGHNWAGRWWLKRRFGSSAV